MTQEEYPQAPDLFVAPDNNVQPSELGEEQ